MRSFAIAAASLSVLGAALAQQAFTGSVTYTLAGKLGACGRVCNGVITCKQSGYSKQCSGADAAVHHDVFFAAWNSSDAVNNPMCSHHVSSIGAISTVVGQVCDFFTTGGSSDLKLSDAAGNPGATTREWLLFSS